MESSAINQVGKDISAYSPTTKQYWALWNSLHLRNGVLYRKFESEDGKTFRQLVLPRSRIPEVLKELHGSPTGYFGVASCIEFERFWGLKVTRSRPHFCTTVRWHGRGEVLSAAPSCLTDDGLKSQQELGPKVPLFLLAYRAPFTRLPDIFTIPDAFWPGYSSPLVTCCLVALRIHLHHLEEYVQNLQARFEDVHNLARERINLRTEKMKTRYDTKAT
ncbi:retrovirus-related Pol polyprotein from transposon 412 [Trichonephila clavipes]|nr:retrovirus-related Pol polyprotein from transposon 412 [Trichonephila clavipes]